MEVADKIKYRKCPACGSPVKEYRFSSILLPYDKIATDALNQTRDIEDALPIFAVRDSAMSQWYRVVLSSECECGHISFWRADFKELVESVNEPENPNILQFRFQRTYDFEKIKERIEKMEDCDLKKSLKRLLSLFKAGDSENA